jgi:hypothetical protein
MEPTWTLGVDGDRDVLKMNIGFTIKELVSDLSPRPYTQGDFPLGHLMPNAFGWQMTPHNRIAHLLDDCAHEIHFNTASFAFINERGTVHRRAYRQRFGSIRCLNGRGDSQKTD